MKIPKATQLPSGSWNVVVMVGGKRHSVTASTKRLAEQEAAALKSGAKEAKRLGKALTVGDAIDQYIDLKRPVLSPATIAGYAKIRKNYMQDIMRTDIYKLTPAQIQRSVNRMSKEHAPKTVCNAHGLISAVLTSCCGLPCHKRRAAKLLFRTKRKSPSSSRTAWEQRWNFLLCWQCGLACGPLRSAA